MNALSAYDIFYTGLSPEDREKIQNDIDGIIAESAKEADDRMTKAFVTAMAEAMRELIVNPWSKWLEENGAHYGAISAMADSMFRSLRRNQPTAIGEHKLKDLIEGWREAYPDDFKAVCEAALVKENEILKESLAFERRLRSNY